ncbi:transmembrane protein, putative [Medicago truncatula]|uniref:Transmembrane protein, putative n=1 Tax=Medicago truncatula TaxID=3880 RepID=G7K6H7_MEDTR|nr:transmembrane protein, putative [Medicago truncatula]
MAIAKVLGCGFGNLKAPEKKIKFLICFLVVATNTYAELTALFLYQKIAKNIGCNHICSYSNSKTTIDIATKPVNKCHYYVFVIASAKELLRMDGEVQL